VEESDFLMNMKRQHAWLRDSAGSVDMSAFDYDEVFFGRTFAPRRLDPRIAAVIAQISEDPSVPAMAGDCAASVNLSFSRFLHLFKEQTGAPFRSMRTWKRARSLLHYVNRPSNLTAVALETGYPDATHFSHSIRQVYGLKPKDIFAGSRRLVLLGKSVTPGTDLRLSCQRARPAHPAAQRAGSMVQSRLAMDSGTLIEISSSIWPIPLPSGSIRLEPGPPPSRALCMTRFMAAMPGR